MLGELLSSAEERAKGIPVELHPSEHEKRVHRCVDSFIRLGHGPRCSRRSVPNRWVRKRALFCELDVSTEGRPSVCFGRGVGQVKVPASLCSEQMGKGVCAVL